uniref:NADH-ubiquinone oxidoreductase chain 4L n=1 Tax=Gabronthus thermarum TaxID=878093 RepID=A0A0S2M7E6_9COLE|nr:NADH dehydrogenase subunit 4L [Gabronthus thermarum]ALO70586.1 NADH deshydrogenase subunit 4L [Gabronthus thermarum]
MFFVSILMYFMGLISFSLKRKHFLLMLLSLEFIILSLYFSLMMFLFFYTYEFYFSMIFLTMSVCEGALGLALMVSIIRTHGNDYFQSFSMLW